MTQSIAKSTSTSKAIYVNEMFSKIAGKYDLLNNLMTFGLHKYWKTYAIKLALKENKNPKEALDMCCGTGDLALILNKYSPETNITCIDNCNEMLFLAKEKIKNKNIKNTNVIYQDSENLRFNSWSFDMITIGFGLRNLTSKEKCIQDIYSLLKPGGVLCCVDLGHSKNQLWKKIFFLYFFKIVPVLGQIFAQNKDAYNYLPNSLITWYSQDELKELILKNKFKTCYYENIFGGAVAVHIAVK